LQIIGCKSAHKIDHMVPLGEENRVEFDHAPGYEEKCLRGKDGVKYTSKVIYSVKYAAIEELCKDKGNESFEHEGLVKKCIFKKESTFVENGARTKCVAEGESAKLIFGEFELCEGRDGQHVHVGNVYKKCVFSNNK
ncbi:hypothetical protein PMAYCL1PPCAC_14174, partial [Pristionchus mayeri]